MSLRAIVLVALVAAPAAFAAGLFQGQHPSAPKSGVTPAPRNPPVIARPGQGVAGAVAYMAALNAPPPPPAPPPRPKPAPPPPPPAPPDVAVLFRQELSAVLTADGQPRAILVSAGRSRSLTPGQVYRDGWTLSTLSPTTAVLTRGDERRAIGVPSPPPVAAAASTSQTVNIQGFAMTNGVQPGRMSPGQIQTVLTALRSSGMNDRQIESMKTTLEGQVSTQAAQAMLQQAARSPQVNQQALLAAINAFSQAGVIPAAQAQALSQSLPQQAQLQQVQQALQGGGGGQGGGNRGNQPGANNGGRGGRGGFNGAPNAGFNGAAAPRAQFQAIPPAPPAAK